MAKQGPEKQYDMLAHMKRGMSHALDAFEAGTIDKDDALDSMSVHALEYHNVLLRRLIDEIGGVRTKQEEPEDGQA